MLLTPEDAAAITATPAAWRDMSVLRDQPFLLVDLRYGDNGLDLLSLGQLPLVVIGVGEPHAACDVMVDAPDELEQVTDAVRRNPQASTTLAQLLRLSVRLLPHEGFVAESLAYATLQSGTEFAAWLSTRGDRVRKEESEPPVLVSRHGDQLRLAS